MNPNAYTYDELIVRLENLRYNGHFSLGMLTNVTDLTIMENADGIRFLSVETWDSDYEDKIDSLLDDNNSLEEELKNANELIADLEATLTAMCTEQEEQEATLNALQLQVERFRNNQYNTD